MNRPENDDLLAFFSYPPEEAVRSFLAENTYEPTNTHLAHTYMSEPQAVFRIPYPNFTPGRVG